MTVQEMAVELAVMAVLAIYFWTTRSRCKHHWKVIQEIDVWAEDLSTTRPVKKVYTLQCKECGDIKRRRGA